MKNLFFVLLFASGSLYAQTEEDTIKKIIESEAKDLRAH